MTMPPKRRIFIFGGSNSVMKDGWVGHFKAAAEGEFEVINRSLGGTSTLMGLYRLFETPELGPGDIAIWEYGVNDHRFSHEKSEYLLVENLAWFLREVRARGAHVFVLMMYGRRYGRDYAAGGVPIYYTKKVRQLIRQHKIANLDLFELLRARFGIGPSAYAAVDALYEDKSHYRLEGGFLKEVALAVLEKLRAAAFAAPAPPLDVKPLRGRRLLFRRAAPGEGQPMFSNSIVTTRYAPVGSKIEIGERAYLKAVIIITSRNGGSLVVPDTRGKGRRAYSLRLNEDLPGINAIFEHIVPEFTNWPRLPKIGPQWQTRRAHSDEKIYSGRRFAPLAATEGDDDGIVALILEEASPAFRRERRRRLMRNDWTYLPQAAFSQLLRWIGVKRG